MRGKQLGRQWKIIRLIESRKNGVTGAELADELEVPLRTVYRDLDAIQQAGFPLYTVRIGKNAYWKVVETFRKDFPFPLTATELMALHMSRDLLAVFQGTIFHDSIESLFEKVKAALPPETLEYLENISGRLKISIGPARKFSGSKEVIKTLSEATANRRRVEILYRAISTGHESRRKIDPYQVWVMNGGFYLIGFCHLRNEVRTFAMDRIKRFSVLEESFTFPKDFNLETYLQDAFQIMRGIPEKVRVAVSKRAAHVVRERIWHPTQEIRELEDGSLVIALEVPINYEVISWILGFGSAAEVLEPESLRKRIEEEHEASIERYRSSEPARKKSSERKKPQHV